MDMPMEKKMKYTQKEINYIIKYHTRELQKMTCPRCGGYQTAVQRFDGYTFAGSCEQCNHAWEYPLIDA